MPTTAAFIDSFGPFWIEGCVSITDNEAAPAGWSTPGWYGPVPGGGGAAPPSLDEAERARYARGAPLDHEMGDYFVQQDPFRV